MESIQVDNPQQRKMIEERNKEQQKNKAPIEENKTGYCASCLIF